MDTNKIDEALIYSYLLGETSLQDTLMIEQSISSSAETHKAVEDVKKILWLNDCFESEKEYDTKEAYTLVSKRISWKKKFMNLGNFFQRVAALLTIPLLASSIYFYKQSSTQTTNNAIAWHELSSAFGVISKVTLPDSSLVWLNSGTTIRYPVAFVDGKREVEIQGEAYFEVKSDIENPFLVKIQNEYVVKALGTGFNVCAYKDEPSLNVYLSHGKVDFVNTTSNKVHKLQEGEEISYNYASGVIDKCNKLDAEAISWRKGKLVFRNTPFKDVVKQISRHYNVKIDVEGKNIYEYTYTASFSTENLEQVLNLLKLTAPLEWKYIEQKKQADDSFSKARVRIRQTK
ncbi:iron dicitrate transporter FecR [Bacteroidales bacterium]|nr:iron dicitrate transporter FecR [Bacteroidales bacterium]